MIPGTFPENYLSIDVDDIIDIALHHEIKFRAYELFETTSPDAKAGRLPFMVLHTRELD